ncbi:5089_t:CDS:2 [Diversispora eburnea]|uniref:5089_t:CDS:1 n=1 Tax=Diversispora eburnea TaxID=1213867 RepID=A0A9N9BLS0_9GLOM|nr:5089_t:CDS:2 [Diversispora eburnea]
MSGNLLPSNNNTFGVDDAFDTYIDMDFLRNDTMEEEVDIGNMSNSDLFHYYLEGELAKDQVNLDSTNYVTMQNVDDFSLATDPDSAPETSSPDQRNAIEDTDVLSQPTNVSTAVGPSLAILNAQLAELLAKLPSIKQEAIIEDKVSSLPDSTLPANSTFVTTSRSTTSNNNNNIANDGQKLTDDNNQIDLKKLSSKERRQLRNKISARNFRVRRKEYIQSLESTKEQQQEEINLLRQALLHLQEENTKLQQEVEELRKQQKQNNKAFVTSPPSPPHISSLAEKEINNNQEYFKNGNSQRSSNQNKSVPQNQSHSSDSRYLIIPNVNKDASPSSSSGSPKTWQDSRVRVQTTFIPEFNLDKHLFEDKPEFSFFDSIACNQPIRRSDLFDAGLQYNGQMAQFAYTLFSTIVQQITVLFFEAVCATPQQEMISALFPNIISSPNTMTESQKSLEIFDNEKREFNIIEREPNVILDQPSLDPLPSNNEIDVGKNEEESNNEINFDKNKRETKIISDQPSLDLLSVNNEINEGESLLDNNMMVEFVEEASVLDWLYDSMVNHVVEQSQMEARIMELSDWVGEEWDDNVLPFLF